MNSENHRLTRDGLIKGALEGKDTAIAAYDSMLWKVRTGYVAVLYGTFTLVIGLSDKSNWPISVQKAAIVAVLLITGFTVCAAALDFHILCSKFRVVQAKEELIDLAIWLTSGKELEERDGTCLNKLLHNSGEGVADVDWTARPSAWPFALLYLGTWGLLCLAVLGLAI